MSVSFRRRRRHRRSFGPFSGLRRRQQEPGGGGEEERAGPGSAGSTTTPQRPNDEAPRQKNAAEISRRVKNKGMRMKAVFSVTIWNKPARSGPSGGSVRTRDRSMMVLPQQLLRSKLRPVQPVKSLHRPARLARRASAAASYRVDLCWRG